MAFTPPLSHTDATRHIDAWLAQALEQGASDLHFESTPAQFQIRCRVDGKLHLLATPSLDVRDSVLSRLKVLARMDIAEKRLPQDGRIRHTVGHQDIDLRVSSLPTVLGEKIVLRLLPATDTLPNFAALGLHAGDASTLANALKKAHGLILFTGPTGSGKTMSLYSCLNHINSHDINICTVEDPCEIRLEGINQTAVNDKIHLTFANCLRALLRQDPDVLMVGEIRDSETAKIATQAAQTGHLVLSTLHAIDAPGAITRLRFMGVESFNIASRLTLVVAQRLVRRLCEHCKQPLTPSELAGHCLNKENPSFKHSVFFKPVGCSRCTLGYRGRIGIFQLMHLTPDLQHHVAQAASEQALCNLAQQQGMRTLIQDGWLKAQQGLTSIEEISHLGTDV